MIIKNTKCNIPFKGSFSVDYEQREGYVVFIDNILQLRDDGEVLRKIENPSLLLHSSLIDHLQEYLDRNDTN